MGDITLILGGARSGKSSLAEKMAGKNGGDVVYIATAEAGDEEMAARIARHRRQRPPAWRTMEIPRDVGRRWRETSWAADVVLLDCVTLLVTNALMAVNPDPDAIDEAASQAAVEAEIEGLITAVQAGNAHWLIVSNEVGLGLVPPYPLGRVYRDLLGLANRRLAGVATDVYFLIAGLPMRLQPYDMAE